MSTQEKAADDAAASVGAQVTATMSLNVFDYLERLPPDALDKLYGAAAATEGQQQQGARSHGQWTCRALLQSLPQLAKQHVMRLLFVEGSVDKGMLKSWVKKEYQRVHAASIRKVCVCLLCVFERICGCFAATLYSGVYFWIISADVFLHEPAYQRATAVGQSPIEQSSVLRMGYGLGAPAKQSLQRLW